jgi:hypothetical protein
MDISHSRGDGELLEILSFRLVLFALGSIAPGHNRLKISSPRHLKIRHLNPALQQFISEQTGCGAIGDFTAILTCQSLSLCPLPQRRRVPIRPLFSETFLR